MKWGKARKKPIVVEFREVIPNRQGRFGSGPYEEVETLEGYKDAIPGFHYIIKGIKGELYPIQKEIFDETYEVIESAKESS